MDGLTGKRDDRSVVRRVITRGEAVVLDDVPVAFYGKVGTCTLRRLRRGIRMVPKRTGCIVRQGVQIQNALTRLIRIASVSVCEKILQLCDWNEASRTLAYSEATFPGGRDNKVLNVSSRRMLALDGCEVVQAPRDDRTAEGSTRLPLNLVVVRVSSAIVDSRIGSV